MSTQALNPLVTKIRTAYPGSYDDLDDATLTKQVLAKYPQYEDLAAPSASVSVPRPVPRALSAPADDNRLTWSGDAPKNPPILSTLGNMAKDTAKNLYQTSIPGVAASLAKQFAPEAAAHIPEPLQGAEPGQLAQKVAIQDALTAVGGLEGGAEPPTPEGIMANRAKAAEAAIPKAAGSSPLSATIRKMIFNRIPGIKTVGDLVDLGKAIEKHLNPTAPEARVEPSPAPLAPEFTPAPKLATEAPPAVKTAPIWRDATRQNVPFAGEDMPDARLPEASDAVVNQAIPPTNRLANLRTKARVDFALKRGDVAAAETALDEGAKGNPNWPPPRPNIVPAVQNIRENNAMVANAEAQPGPAAADRMDDRALSQEMNWNLEKHGYRAESEARREFIARNSTGVTKGDLVKQAQPPSDLTPEWQAALDAVKKNKSQAPTQ